MDGLTILPVAMPGQRITDEKNPEDGSILACRKDGDEVLFASWNPEMPVGMIWIPVGEFSPDPESIRPPDIDETGGEDVQAEDGTNTEERPAPHGPFGKGGLRRRPSVDG